MDEHKINYDPERKKYVCTCGWTPDEEMERQHMSLVACALHMSLSIGKNSNA